MLLNHFSCNDDRKIPSQELGSKTLAPFFILDKATIKSDTILGVIYCQYLFLSIFYFLVISNKSFGLHLKAFKSFHIVSKLIFVVFQFFILHKAW
jgi:hypothetical protein